MKREEATMHAPTPHPQRGFSLIEVMVGLAIGMATVVIMMQMLLNSDAMKRNASGGNDAQMTGTLALYTLERDIRASGYGISAFNILGCTLRYKTSTDGATVTVPLAPTTINPSTGTVPAGDANTDTLLVVYGSGGGSSEGDPLVSVSTPSTYQVTTGSAFAANDIVVGQSSVRPTPCALTTDQVLSISGPTLTVTPGVSGLAVGAIIYNLGNAPVVHAYAVRNGNLTMCDYRAYDCGKASYATTLDSNVWVPISGNIVALHAQYGRDATSGSMTGVVTTYDQTTPGSAADLSGNSVFCGWTRTLSMRVGLVARSVGYDKSSPTTVAPTWSGSTVVSSPTTPTNPTALPFDLSATATGAGEWKKFRYKTLETTVPMRNAIWQGGQATYQGGSGC
jgi:type IV pilus assembly protein PilW